MKTIIVLCSALGLWLCGPAIAETHVDDLTAAKVIGHLGKSLGSRVTIEGTLHEGGMIVNPLRLSSIDGRPTNDEVVVIEIRGKPQIQKGVHYHLEGYEAGAFSGQPSWSAPGAQQPFLFRSYFIVTKVIEPKSK